MPWGCRCIWHGADLKCCGLHWLRPPRGLVHPQSLARSGSLLALLASLVITPRWVFPRYRALQSGPATGTTTSFPEALSCRILASRPSTNAVRRACGTPWHLVMFWWLAAAAGWAAPPCAGCNISSQVVLASGGRSIARFQAAQRRLKQPDLAFVEVDLSIRGAAQRSCARGPVGGAHRRALSRPQPAQVAGGLHCLALLTAMSAMSGP